MGIRRPDPKARLVTFKAGSGLGALVFVEVHAALNPAYGRRIETLADDLQRAQVVLDVKLQHPVEQIVGRQRVLVLLVGLEFGAGRFLNRGKRE